MRAAATLHERSSTLVVTDEPLGPATLWSLRSDGDRRVYTVPDLSCDVVWLPGERPVVSTRTVAPFSTQVDGGGCVVGIRFPPAVVAIRIDRAWEGWGSGAVDPRRELRRACAAGAIRAEVDGRLARLLAQLDRPRLRIAAVAAQLGTSERQLQRWTREATGLTPKELHRHIRLRRFWELDPSVPLAQRAVVAGYYDQAHAAADARAIAGLSPRQLLRFAMSDPSKTSEDALAETGSVDPPPPEGRSGAARLLDHLRA